MNLSTFIKLGEYEPSQDAETTLFHKILTGMISCEVDHCDVVRVIFPEGETVDLLTERGPSWPRKDTVAKIEFYVMGKAA